MHSILPDSPFPQQQSFDVENSPTHRERKGKKVTSTSSIHNEIFDLIIEIADINIGTSTKVEQRERYEEEKLRILHANEE